MINININKKEVLVKKNKIIPLAGMALAVCSLVTIPQQSLAVTNDIVAQEDSIATRLGDFFGQYGEIGVTRYITINGVENPLFCEFLNPASALNNFKKLEKASIDDISLKYGLDELSSENWEEYQAAAYESDSRALVDFFDIYENTKKNDEAESFASSMASTYALDPESEEIQLEQLSFMLPYFSPLAEEYNSSTNAGSGISAHATLPNVSAAVSYAERYAWNANTAQYKDFGGTDCTNFVSQILEAGGVSQDSYTNESYGWWHRIVNGRHEHSISWIRSDTFARYMGVGYTTDRIMNFSTNIQVGDAIALDNNSDGDWDHMGFVTYKASRPGSYTLDSMILTYTDFIIAQHSSNYNSWVSENHNNWDRYDWTFGGRGTYGRVRR